MSDRAWIKIHNGLTDDPKHREQMGVRIWYFMWLVSQADWETGVVLGYTDSGAGEDMSISPRTIERQRQELEKSGYIICHKGNQCLNIRIMRWRNPKLVNPPMINVPDDETTWYAVPRTHPNSKLRTHPPNKLRTPSIDQNPQTLSEKDSAAPAAFTPDGWEIPKDRTIAAHPAIQAFREATHRYPAKSWYEQVCQIVGHDDYKLAAWSAICVSWVGKGWNATNVEGMLDVFQNGWENRPKNGARAHGKPFAESQKNVHNLTEQEFDEMMARNQKARGDEDETA